MGQDYLVVAGRITRDGLERALMRGFLVRIWAQQGQVAAALVVKTSRSAERTDVQHNRLYSAGQVCVHTNPDSETVRRIVVGVLTHDAELLGPLQHRQSA